MNESYDILLIEFSKFTHMPCFCKSCKKEFGDAFDIAEHFMGKHSQLDFP